MSVESADQAERASEGVEFVDLMSDCEAIRRFSDYDDIFGDELSVPILYEPL